MSVIKVSLTAKESRDDIVMTEKPTYKELELRFMQLEIEKLINT
jgi:hypothetical protein